MKPRERVLAAINHEEPDRVPICIGVSNATGMKMKPYRELKQLARDRCTGPIHLRLAGAGHGRPDEETMERLHSDVRAVLDLEPADVMARNHQRAPHTPWIDSWGSGQVELTDDVWFPGVHPLAEATTLEEIEHYPWPDMDDPTRVAHVRDRGPAPGGDRRLRHHGHALAAVPLRTRPRHAGHGQVPAQHGA